jgi:hypothetical protein
MRLGLSMMLMAALAAGSVACSSSTGDTGTGGGGTGGATGSGGDDSSVSAGGNAGTGGDAGTGGSTSDGICDSENVLVEADGTALCDEDCDVAFSNGNPDVAQCTISCETDADCGDLTCFADDAGNSACLFDCLDGNACPGTGEYVCDETANFCDPDGVAG